MPAPTPTPIDKISYNNISIDLKRDDQIHATISGSKFRKYQSLVQHLQQNNFETILVHGSSRSQHVRNLMHYIQQYEPDLSPRITAFLKFPHSPMAENDMRTLNDLYGRRIIWSDRIERDHTNTNDVFHIPEGAFCKESLNGAISLGAEILNHTTQYDHIYFDAGTGMSAFSSIAYLMHHNYPAQYTVITMADTPEILKNAWCDIIKWCEELGMHIPNHIQKNLHITPPLTAKSFGARNATITKFTEKFESENQISLHPLYSSKLLHFVFHTSDFQKNQRNLAVHSG